MESTSKPLLSSVRIARGLTQIDLARAAGISQSVVSGIERGRITPDDGAVTRIATALSAPPGLVTHAHPSVRIVAAMQSSLPAHATNRLAADLAIAHVHLERLLDRTPLTFPSVVSGSSPTERARMLRRHWRVHPGPITHMIALVEAHGITCVVRDISAVHLDAVGSWPAGGRPVVFVRTGASPLERRLALARELAYAVSPESALSAADADEFATEFLMPQSDAVWTRTGRLDRSRLAHLEEEWGLPPSALLAHATRSGVITRTHHRELLSVVREIGSGARSAPEEKPGVLLDAVLRLRQTRSLADVARDALLNEDDLRRSYLADSSIPPKNWTGAPVANTL